MNKSNQITKVFTLQCNYGCFSVHIWCGIALATDNEFELSLVLAFYYCIFSLLTRNTCTPEPFTVKSFGPKHRKLKLMSLRPRKCACD